MTVPDVALAFSVDQMIALARGVADRKGARGSISIRHTVTRRRDALAFISAPGGGPAISAITGFDRDAPVYVVLVEGDFAGTDHADAGPRRGQASLLLLVGAESGRIVGSRVVVARVAPPDLAAVGPVTVDAVDVSPSPGWSPWSAGDREALGRPGHVGKPG